MQPALILVADSTDMGLPRGDLAQLDSCIGQLPREQLVVRTVAILHALHAKRETFYRDVNRWFFESAAPDIQERLRPILAKPDTTFLEPLQQILILRRALAVRSETKRILDDAEATRVHFDVCRFAADVARLTVSNDITAPTVNRWLEVGAAMMPRLALTSPINPNYWIARRRLLLDRLPEVQPDLRSHTEAIKARFAECLGAEYETCFHGDEHVGVLGHDARGRYGPTAARSSQAGSDGVVDEYKRPFGGIECATRAYVA